VINDLNKHPATCDLSIISEANVGSYLGIPIFQRDGVMFGTICAIDPDPYAFSSNEIELMKSLAKILSQVVTYHMPDQHTKKDQLAEQKKMSMVGEMAAGFAHEIRNPLQSVRGFIQFLFDEENDPKGYKKIMLDDLDRIKEIVHDFVLATQPPHPKKEKVLVKDLVTKSVQSLQTMAILENIRISIDFADEQSYIYADEIQMKQVFINLLTNSIEAIGTNGNIWIQTRSQANTEFVFCISDNGSGIPISILDSVSHPFFSTKENATGMGLSISRRIVEAHGGMISIESGKQGTTIYIKLPIN
jgi:two-component system, sporulation sensor kinase E